MSKYEYIVLDTPILKYSAKRSRYYQHEHSKEILQSIINEDYIGILPTPVLAELYYKIAEKQGETKAEEFLNLVTSMNNVLVSHVEETNARFAGKIYFNYNYDKENGGLQLKDYKDRISVIDCLIISVGNDFPNSVVCTYDESMLDVIEVDVKKPGDILGID